MNIDVKRVLIVIVSLMTLLTYNFPFSSYLRIGIICGVAYLFIFKQRKMTKKMLACVLSYVLFITWGILSLLWAVSSASVNEHLFNMIVSICANISMMLYIVSKKEEYTDINKWMVPIMLLFMVQSLLVGNFNSEGRFSATGAVNQFGLTASYIYLIVLFQIKSNRKCGFIYYVLLVLSLLLSLFTGSRKTLVNIILFTCLVLFFEKYNKNVVKNIGKVFFVLVIGIIALVIVMKVDVLYNVLGYRLESLFSYFNGEIEADLSALRRDYMKEDAIIMFKNHPILGVGLNNFKYLSRYGTYAHSNYYELLSCLGLVGTFLYYIPIGIALLLSYRQWKKNYIGAIVPLGILLSMVITEFSNVSYVYRYIHLFLGYAIGLVLLREYHSKKKEEV